MANINAAVEARQTSHQIPLYFFFCSICKNFRKNKVAMLNQKKSFQLIPIDLLFLKDKGMASNAPVKAMTHFAQTSK
jgi:hypothetical protein